MPSKNHLAKLVSFLRGPTGGVKKHVGAPKTQQKNPLEVVLECLAQESLTNLEDSTQVALKPNNEKKKIVDIKQHPPASHQ